MSFKKSGSKNVSKIQFGNLLPVNFRRNDIKPRKKGSVRLNTFTKVFSDTAQCKCMLSNCALLIAKQCPTVIFHDGFSVVFMLNCLT